MVILVICLGSAGCDDFLRALGLRGPEPPGQPETHTVTISDGVETLVFDPDPVSVSPGDTIKWNHPFAGAVTLRLDTVPCNPRQLVIDEGEIGEVIINLDAPSDRYKYDAFLVTGTDTIRVDPYIDVEPGRRRSP
ncbi:MAG: hypothetical protein PVJ76_03185 [Gemmatimonadota bacterium]